MYRDQAQWTAVRDRILIDGASRRQVQRETGISLPTINKMLVHSHPPSPVKRVYARPKTGPHLKTVARMLAPDPVSPAEPTARAIYDTIRAEGFSGTEKGLRTCLTSLSRRRFRLWAFIYDVVVSLNRRRAIEFLFALSCAEPPVIPPSRAEALEQACKLVREVQWEIDGHRTKRRLAWEWMHDLAHSKLSEREVRRDIGDTPDLARILRELRDGRLRHRQRAVAVLARRKGIDKAAICDFLGISKEMIHRAVQAYEQRGIEALFAKADRGTRMKDDEEIKKTVFAVLHQPPRDYGLNRTTWTINNLRAVLARKGVSVGYGVISDIVWAAGYRWRKARLVLTSHDPAYTEKVARIRKILSGLKDDEAFFSIDEFGPFRVRMVGGRSLTPPNVDRAVPLRQKSKGTVLLTAALELRTNQVTHFYSERKNTAEMIRMMRVLTESHRHCRKIYLSWDAAGWHMSKKLAAEIEQHNAGPERTLPLVEAAPLPSGAQFLNVIESVFSGLARAVIHNSNYVDTDEAKAAIDRHFAERNEQFRRKPRRAGRQIWGREREPAEFSEGNNCKDPRYSFVVP